MKSLCLLVVVCGCLWYDASAALTSAEERRVSVDFTGTYQEGAEECAESFAGPFANARITMSGEEVIQDESFYVTITSHLVASSETVCTQYGGGLQIRECEMSEYHVHKEPDSEKTVVSFPLGYPENSERSSVWTICIGRNENVNKVVTKSTVFASGDIVLSSSNSILSHFDYDDENLSDVKEKARIGSRSPVKTTAMGHNSLHLDSVASACVDGTSYANGYCNLENNVADCNYDGGDCCFEDCTHSSCLEDMLSYPKYCHKDETVIVNYFQDQSLNSSEYCAPNSDFTNCSLRDAIDFCQEYVVGDHSCIIEISAGVVEIESGQISLADTNRSLIIRGAGSSDTVVKNAQSGDSRFLHIHFDSVYYSSTAIVVERISVIDFSMTGDWGGAVYCVNLMNGTFHDVHFHNNSAAYGGGMYAKGIENAVFTGVVFAENRATSIGGGIYMTNSLLSVFESSAFSFNTASAYAGGIYLSNVANISFEISRFSNNEAGNCGGAVYLDSAFDIVLSGIDWTNNAATFGGALYTMSSQDITLHSNYFSDNVAAYRGGSCFQFALQFHYCMVESYCH